MANYPPEYCPYCGSELKVVREPTVFRCDSCADHVFHNPVPQARVAVIDGDRLLLAKIPTDEDPLWSIPGGTIEVNETPPQAAARELKEETGLDVDPGSLTPFDTCAYEKWEGLYKVSLLYAMDSDNTTGALTPDGVEHPEVRFWMPSDFEDDGQALGEFYDLPGRYRDVRWWHRTARDALDD